MIVSSVKHFQGKLVFARFRVLTYASHDNLMPDWPHGGSEEGRKEGRSQIDCFFLFLCLVYSFFPASYVLSSDTLLNVLVVLVYPLRISSLSQTDFLGNNSEMSNSRLNGSRIMDQSWCWAKALWIHRLQMCTLLVWFATQIVIDKCTMYSHW